MVPTSEKGRFYAFGRVFSGTLRSDGQKVRIQGPNYVPGKKDDLFIKAVQGVFVMLGRDVESLEECPAGNLIALAGIDHFLLKNGTITSSETTHNMRALRFSVPQFIQVAVGVQNPKDLPALIEGLKIFSKSDSLVEVSVSASGEHLIAAVGEDHLATLVEDLTHEFVKVPVTVSDPIIQYRESVGAESAIQALSKSPNRHNRIYARAMPLGEELTRGIESRHVRSRDGFKVRARLLADEYGWEVTEGRKIWTFGPDATGPNLLVDCTRGVQYLNEIKDSCVAGFQWATKEGTGRQCNADAIHRGGGQIIPTMRRAAYAAYLLAQPVLQEPVLLVQIECPETVLGGVHQCVYVPVQQSLGLPNALHAATSGKALMQSEFDHWAAIPGSPLDKGSEVEGIVTKIRTRKGLDPAIPELGRFYDKL
ncbi:Elongation factor 2 [Mycena sanguinolenta]|uniref:Elongation factor 2 n=1 Tax=Mycena sanguinolenta TaxID=230812 RepID=A0A8H7CWZ1_9AGAR|nr:Elongation factor 2 [Mycena sanguinolenta]